MYANTCWGLLGLAVTFGLAVLGLPADHVWLSPWFFGAAVACGVGSIICFGWPLRQKDNRAKFKELCTHPLKAAKLIEPLHIVVLGLLITLGGVVWQYRRMPANDPQVAALQIEVTNLREGLAKALQPKTPTTRFGQVQAPQPNPEPKRYTAYEKEQRLRAVDEIYNAIATSLQPAYSEGRKVVYGVYRAVDDKSEQHLTEYANKVQGAFDSLNALLKKYNYFTDIVQAATKNTFNDVAATHGVKNLVPELQELRAKAPNDIQWFLLRDSTMLDAINQINSFERYLNETLPRLQEKRAEIEKAEVYSGQ